MSDPLDLRGLRCPLPALLARKTLARLPAGTDVEVLADDPMAAVDIPHMCHRDGFTFLSTGREGAVTRFVLRRPGAIG
jgi:tRNA 2-thiouridine synthesizing protein A